MEKLDTVHEFETPEGIALRLRTAGPVVRAGAFVVDGLIRGVVYIAAAVALGLFGNFGLGALLIVMFVLEWFYPVLFELRSGATPGKRSFGLTVVNDDGTPVTWTASVLRNLMRAADFLPAFYAVGLVSTLVNRRFQRLGDIVAGTLVVYRDEAQGRALSRRAKPKAPPITLEREEQMALLDFPERLNEISVERSEELAGILQPVTGKQGPAAVAEVIAYANWLARGS